MDSGTRLETAWSFREPDRVPIELAISGVAHDLPEAQRIIEFVDTEADNFGGAPLVNWGFFGLDSEYREDVIEDVPGEYKRIRRTHTTPVGDFVAVTRHRHEELDKGDFHWEQRFIKTPAELERLAEAPRGVRPADPAAFRAAREQSDRPRLMATGLLHPLGTLVRSSTMEEVYGWMLTENRMMHRFLETCTRQIVESLLQLEGEDLNPVFLTFALEMLISPWIGRRLFDELVFPYDKHVNDAVHRIGGRHRAHCHGNSGSYLERFLEMGIDGIEPLEPPPYGDNDLAAAKRTVGDRMLLSGNVVSQDFLRLSVEEVREQTRAAIRIGAPGGGFSLHCTGGTCGTGGMKSMDQVLASLKRVEAYMDAALEFGAYPIRC